MKWLFFGTTMAWETRLNPDFLFESAKEYQLDFIAILETKKTDFTSPELAHYCVNKNFSWSCTPPRGWSGGVLLMGVSLETINVQNIIHGNFYLKFKLIKNKSDNFEWILIAVYGAAQEEKKDSFYGNLYKLVV
jgi:hypothetical protein